MTGTPHRRLTPRPTIVATYYRARNGADPLEPQSDLGFAENYLYMLTGEDPTDAETRGLKTYLNAVVDPGSTRRLSWPARSSRRSRTSSRE